MDTSQLEYSIVGAICIEPKICDKISGILSPDDFSISACSEVFEAACDALGRGKHFDAVLAADAIRNRVDDAVRFTLIQFISASYFCFFFYFCVIRHRPMSYGCRMLWR